MTDHADQKSYICMCAQSEASSRGGGERERMKNGR